MYTPLSMGGMFWARVTWFNKMIGSPKIISLYLNDIDQFVSQNRVASQRANILCM